MDVEEQIGRLRTAGQLKDVATLAIEGYGPEVLSFLEMMLRDHADASDAFAQACEDLWKGLPRFEGRSSMKTWFYTLARHAASRLRSRTRPHLRTEIKHGFAAIRDALDDDDRMLLVLRVDRAMSWNDIARVMADESDSDSSESTARIAARLRKRFQSVKETIRERAIAQGLIPDIGPDAE
jgi:RNA polymerase sigma-70 factor (ECF subfamily)